MALISIFILFCAFQIYEIQNVSSSKTRPFKIDDFIDQLMTSKKFSELTDIVAEKAAKKIKSVQQDKKQELRSVKPLRIKDDTQIESETAKENENVKSRKGVSTTKFGKINTDAFLKQDFKSGEILLNYKHMTAELKRSDHKTNRQKNDENLSDRDRGTRPDRNGKMNREKHSEKPMYQSKEHIMQPRKQYIKINELNEEIERNFNKMNKSMNQDSMSAEIIYNNVNDTANVEASEEHEIFIKTHVDEVSKSNVIKGPNSNENLDKYANPDEKNEVDTKSIKNPTNSDENVEKSTKAVKTPEISNKELDEHDKSIKNPERSSKNDKEYHESINDPKSTNEKFEQNAQVMESSEKTIKAYVKTDNLNKKTTEYHFNESLKKYSETIEYQENTNEKLEISSTPVEVLIETQNQPKPQKNHLIRNGYMQNNNGSKRKRTIRFRTQKSKTASISDQTTEHVEDYSDVLNFGGAKDTLLKEPILKVPYPIISRGNGKIYKHNYSEPDYKEYHDKFVTKGKFINI